ncbi:MAG: spore coat associated protein CotJA [Acutalibacteraceae bacterium]
MNNDYTRPIYDESENGDMSAMPLDSLPIAMAYVPMQKWQRLYEPEVALERGTLFSELDLPFIGKAACDDD